MDLALVILGLIVGAAGAWVALRSRPVAPLAPSPELLEAVRGASAQGVAAQGPHLGHHLVQLAEAKYGALHERTDTVLEGHARTVDQGLQALTQRLERLENERKASTTELATMVRSLTEANEATRTAAVGLTSALRDNRARGVWGEVQLRRVLELAGMDRHVDFVEQRGVTGSDGSGRPDVVVPLANGRCVVIDAKVPLDRYLDAANATDPDQQAAILRDHAKAVGNHVTALVSRRYTDMVDGSIDFVLLFLPGDPFLAAALDADPTLLESAASKGVHLVTPSSLIPVLRGIALGWREHQAEQAAADILALGVELYDRIAIFAEHHAKVGAQLEKTVAAYNDSVGSLDHRLLVAARRMAEHGSGSARPLPETQPIDLTARALRAVEVNPAVGSIEPSSEIEAGGPGPSPRAIDTPDTRTHRLAVAE